MGFWDAFGKYLRYETNEWWKRENCRPLELQLWNDREPKWRLTRGTYKLERRKWLQSAKRNIGMKAIREIWWSTGVQDITRCAVASAVLTANGLVNGKLHFWPIIESKSLNRSPKYLSQMIMATTCTAVQNLVEIPMGGSGQMGEI